MAGVHFYQHRLSNTDRTLTVEDAFRFYGAQAGIHDFKFDELLGLADISGWIGAVGTFDASSVTFSSTADAWSTLLHVEDLPSSYVLSYLVDSAHHAAVVGYESTDRYYMIGADANGYPTVWKAVDGTVSVAQVINETMPQMGTIKTEFKQEWREENGTSTWVSISMWINERQIISFSEINDTPIQNTAYGFAVYDDTASVKYANVRIPQLGEIAEYGTLDPGEVPIGGLQRVIEGRYLKFFMRGNNALRAYRTVPTLAIAELISDQVDHAALPIDLRQMKTHVRMMGAYTWAEAIDTELMTFFGHRFQEQNNPMLLTELDCYREAVKALKRIREDTFTETTTMDYNPLLEIEDRIETPNGSRLISSFSVEFDPGSATTELELREYVWGEP